MMDVMKRNDQTRELLLTHFYKYPDLQIRDIFKFLYQSIYGCEHMISSCDNAVKGIEEEYSFSRKNCKFSEVEKLDGKYIRVPLSYIDNGLSAETFGKLFYLSAKKDNGTSGLLLEKLDVVRNMISEEVLPFSENEFDCEFHSWKEKGFSALHHSDVFREKYKPSYRVISEEFLPFLPLFAELDKLLKSGCVKIAIEGGSASGKTTLSRILENIYDCTVFHMDDFFLRPEQRSSERYAQTGGNVDKERFLQEVLVPLSKGEIINYRRFDCSEMKLTEPVCVCPGKLTVIEGAYSMHPELREFYDFSVFLDISPELQRERIEKRNTPQQSEQFFQKWIPFENRYFSEMHIKEKCDINIIIK